MGIADVIQRFIFSRWMQTLFEPHPLGEQTLGTYLLNLAIVRTTLPGLHYQVSKQNLTGGHCHQTTRGSVR